MSLRSLEKGVAGGTAGGSLGGVLKSMNLVTLVTLVTLLGQVRGTSCFTRKAFADFSNLRFNSFWEALVVSSSWLSLLLLQSASSSAELALFQQVLSNLGDAFFACHQQHFGGICLAELL